MAIVSQRPRTHKYLISSLMRLKIGIVWSLFLGSIVFIPPANANLSHSLLTVAKTDTEHESNGLNENIAAWEREAELYRAQNETAKEIETLLKVSQGYISLGQFRAATIGLNRIISLNPSSEKLAIAQKRLGDAYSGTGEYKQAISSYKSSLQNRVSVPTLNNLVRVHRDRQRENRLKVQNSRREEDARPYQKLVQRDRTLALKYARRALIESQSQADSSTIRALIEWHHLNNRLSPRQLKRGQTVLENLPSSPSSILLALDWAKIDATNRINWLYRASNDAQKIDNSGLLSYVLLELSHSYRDLGALELATEYAQKASRLAQSSNTQQSLFRAQRSLGQMYRKMGQEARAVGAYRNAVASIDLVGKNLGITDTREIVEFNQEIEPIYREAIDLLLDTPNESRNLDEALLIFDKLRLAQLKRYFGDNCFAIKRPDLAEQSNSAPQNIALINSIILEDRTVFILQLPDGRTITHEARIQESELTSLAEQWYEELITGFTWEFSAKSRSLYDLIVRPFEAELTAANPETLVFIHDGILRNLPMAALNDGEQYLAQKWASISSIGLDYVDSTEEQKESEVVAFGMEDGFPSGWSKLPGVRAEIASVQNIVGGKDFFGEDFTADNFYRQLNQNEYEVVHLATHGYFGGTADTSFILAHDQRISATELENVLAQSKQIPQLLVLSACETAVGSELALLGLAGIGARSGVTTTLGSLWEVDDESQSKAVEDFYSRLENSTNESAQWTTKTAIALQQIQIEQIRNLVHPRNWAALTLISSL